MRKKILSLLTFALLAVAPSHAQLLGYSWMPEYKLGFTAGVNMPTFSGTGYEYTAGLHAGLDLMLDASSLISGTYARVGLQYSMKGATGNGAELYDDGTSHVYDIYYTTHYIQIPVHYGYSWALDGEGGDWVFTAETGPYFAYGLGGKAREEGRKFSESRSFFSGYDACRFDFGWGLQAGLLFDQQLMLNVGYDWGFKNLTSNFLQNNMLFVGFTFFFDY